MDRSKRKLNLTVFLKDFRSGVSAEELMKSHALNEKSLEKVFKILLDRRLVESNELVKWRRLSGMAQEEETQPLTEPTEEAVPQLPRPRPAARTEPGAECPQCGAATTDRMLTCPECGHVLPGEKRWSSLAEEKPLLSRVPPWAIGCLIALPLALGLFLVFKHVLIPMSRASIEQRNKLAVARPPVPAPHPQAPKERPIEIRVRSLMDSGVLESADYDYSTFVVSERWEQLSNEERIRLVDGLALALMASNSPVSFQVKNSMGELHARVTVDSIEFVDRHGFTRTHSRILTLAPPSPADKARELESRVEDLTNRIGR